MKEDEFAFGGKGEEARACFVYGSLRPDDDSGMPWTEKAVEGMMAQRATISGFSMFKKGYACAVKSGNPKDKLVGWILTTKKE